MRCDGKEPKTPTNRQRQGWAPHRRLPADLETIKRHLIARPVDADDDKYPTHLNMRCHWV